MKRRTLALAALSNEQLIRKGDLAVRTRHELAIEILDCLNEIERRSLYLEEGYSSLFDYCTRHWYYSPPKACRTIAVARCIQNFPQVRTLLVDRKITLCGVARIAAILTDENSRNLLREVSGKKIHGDRKDRDIHEARSPNPGIRPADRSSEKMRGHKPIF